MHSNRVFGLESLEARQLPSTAGPCLLLAEPVGDSSLTSDGGTDHGFGCGCGGCATIEPVHAQTRLALPVATPQVLFLNFDGDAVTSNPCGFSYSTPYAVPTFSLSSYGFGGLEETAEDYILQFVREDFAAFDVTVTNTRPLSGAYSTIYMDDFSFEGGGVLGIACYDVDNHDRDDFGFVFTREFGSYAGDDLRELSQYLANVVSHEAGHLFGLKHVSGTTLMNSYLNHSPVQAGFGPGSTQNSEAVLAANLGYREGIADDFGDDAAAAPALGLDESVQGLLELRADVDAFQIVSNFSQELSLRIETSAFGNLDSFLTVTNASGTVIATNDDVDGGQDSSVTFLASAGQEYTVLVSSAGGASSGTYTLHAITANGGSPAIFLTESAGTASDGVIDFDAVAVGTATRLSFTIANAGGAPLVLDGVDLSGDNPFSIDLASNPGTDADNIELGPGKSRTFTVTYAPISQGNHSAVIEILSNDPDEPNIELDLTGFAGIPNAVFAELDGASDGQFTLGDVPALVATPVSVVTVSNDGNAPLQIALTLDSQNDVGFAVAQESLITIAPGQSQVITLDITPLTATSVDDVLTIESNDATSGSATVALSGQAYMSVAGKTKFSFGSDSGGDVVVSLKGAGEARVYLGDEAGTIQQIALEGTDLTSKLNIKSATSVILRDLYSDGSLKSLTASTTTLEHGAIQLAGAIGKLALGGVIDGSLSATRFAQVALGGDMIDSLLLANANDGESPAIEKVRVLGSYKGSVISAGFDQTQLAAVLGGAPGTPGNGAIGAVTLASVNTDNGGIEFGVLSNGTIASVKVGVAKLTLPFVSDDFVVAVLS